MNNYDIHVSDLIDICHIPQRGNAPMNQPLLGNLKQKTLIFDPCFWGMSNWDV